MKLKLIQGRAGKPSPIPVKSVQVLFFFLFLSAALPMAFPQGNGVVEGVLVNRTDPSVKPADVELDIVGVGGGMSIIKSGKTDKSGRFKIDGLPTGSPLMVRVTYKDVNYLARMSSFDASGKATVEVPVYDSTASVTGIRLDSARFAFQLDSESLRCVELYSLVNATVPPKSYMNMEGNFRFSKAPGIQAPPRMNVTAPGSSMPLNQSPLESQDGQSYYSLFPLRPGTTTFEVDQQLPYAGKSYTYKKKFYQDVASFEIGVIPHDMTLSGAGIAKVEADAQRNFAVYRGGPAKAGTEVEWTLSGGTAPAPMAEPAPQQESKVRPMPSHVVLNSMIIAPLFLLGLIVVLWYASNRIPEISGQVIDARIKELRSRRDQLLNHLAGLENQYENKALERREYLRQREQGKRQLRRISLLLKK
jgi:hypothetical protein